MTEDKILLAARYIGGDLDRAESEQFKQKLLTDTELQQYVADYKRAEENLKMHFADDQQRDQLQATLQKLNQQYFAEDKTEHKVVSLKPYIKWISVAAVLVIGLFIWSPWNNDLYKQYANDNKMLVTERGQTSELDKAAAFYNHQEFDKAAVILAELYKKDSENALTAFYYGSSLTELNQLTKAHNILEKLAAGNSVYKFDAAYTIALSYLKNNDKVNCKLWLEKIPAGTAKYEKAQELLKKL
ncbi:hypothetical protein [Pedobacter montanisoli]|uniref:Tetratricopeptide repeat protein n=1 Tax=Pedobacter montanisoli TaxID=2923277 RepID=A0ABS9ZR83_9SPHI|nr:hypothetical protein [Pedobacter montanisoli]MCJ0741110.1 hypothetical protein [Pedobacter montanisoli]